MKTILPTIEELSNPSVKRNTILQILRGEIFPEVSEVKEKFKTHFTNQFSERIYDETYRFHGMDSDINDTLWRVALDIASNEKDIHTWATRFYLIMQDFAFMPGGRITSNAGTGLKGTTYVNCFVSDFGGEDQDSMDGILRALSKQAKILKSEGGYGFCASVMRPSGEFISGIGNSTPGAVRMLDMWDTQSKVITKGSDLNTTNSPAGKKKKIRKGAQMVTLHDWHPDIVEFITAKQSPGRLENFNMSVLISDRFMDAVKNDKPWDLVFPDMHASAQVKDAYVKTWDGNLDKWISLGLPVKIHRSFDSARELWDLIIRSTYNRNEPGVLFVDTINRMNNLKYNEYIMATNPCGEQVLSSNSSCLLSSLNLVNFIDENSWDLEKIAVYINVGVRFMDNVVDRTLYPLPEIEKMSKQNRRIGLGVLGYASALYMMKSRYGSKSALKKTDVLMTTIKNEAYRASALLAEEKGYFPSFQKEYLDSEFVKTLDPDVIKLIEKHGMRNSHLTSIQPTGNSSVYANLVSGGQEPVFSPISVRTVSVVDKPEGLSVPKVINWADKTYSSCNTDWAWVKEGDDNLLSCSHDKDIFKIDRNRGLLKEEVIMDYAVKKLTEMGLWDNKAEWAVSAQNLSIEDHLGTMTMFAKHIDSSASKTINVPNSYPFDDFKEVYLRAWETGVIKGVTTYREGTMASVLATADSQKKAANKIHKTKAPERPKTLPCEIYRVTAEHKKWVVLVGILEEDPFEVFAFKEKELELGSDYESGRLTKVRGGEYKLEYNSDKVIENLKDYFETDAQEALTRIISTALRHGTDVEFIVSQLQKSEGTISSFSKAIARVLKKYVKEAKSIKCSQCASKNIGMQEGCFVCRDCGNSKCS